MTARLRRLPTLVAVLALLAVPLSAAPDLAAATPAEASTCTVRSAMERQSRELVASARSRANVRVLRHNTDMRAVARRHSLAMCNRNSLYHNPNVGRQVTGWRALGENVGRGPTVARIHTGFMNSPGHRANIVDRRWKDIGVGVATDASGRVYVTQVFRQRA